MVTPRQYLGTPARHSATWVAVVLLVLIAAPPPGALPRGTEAARLMNALTNGRPGQAEQARYVILVRRDTRFIAVLIELLRAGQIGRLPGSDDQAIVHALQALSGQAFGAEWPAWAEWYRGTALEPPPGFTGWKGRLLARVDPRSGRVFSAQPFPPFLEDLIQAGGLVRWVRAQLGARGG